MGTFWTGLCSKDSIRKIRVVPPLLEQHENETHFLASKFDSQIMHSLRDFFPD